MNKFDAVIIGAGRVGRYIADRASAQGKKTVLIAFPENPEDYLERLVAAIQGSSPLVGGENIPSSSVVTSHPALAIPHFINPHTLIVDGREMTAKRFVIASGCRPKIPDELKDALHMTPVEIFSSGSTPPSSTVVGAGPAAVCTALRLAKQRTRVTLVHGGRPILCDADEDISRLVCDLLSARDVSLQVAMPSAQEGPVILAAGLTANSAGLGLDKIGAYVAPSGRVAVDEAMRTPASHIYGAGAVTGPPFDLGVESLQMAVAAENLFAPFFSVRRILPEPLPRIVPFDPPIASVGMTERQARKKFRDIHVQKSECLGGLLKLVGRRRGGELLGAHLCMPGAGELILYFDLILQAGISLADVFYSRHFPAPGTAPIISDTIEAWLQNTRR